jgi:hypothetical protein
VFAGGAASWAGCCTSLLYGPFHGLGEATARLSPMLLLPS